MEKYTLEPAGSSKIAASLCALCAQGQIGEHLVRKGVSQSGFALFVARLAQRQLVEKKKTAEEFALILEQVSAVNASAARQALADCNLFAEGVSKKDKEGKLQPVLLKTYWDSLGGGPKAAINVSDLL